MISGRTSLLRVGNRIQTVTLALLPVYTFEFVADPPVRVARRFTEHTRTSKLYSISIGAILFFKVGSSWLLLFCAVYMRSCCKNLKSRFLQVSRIMQPDSSPQYFLHSPSGRGSKPSAGYSSLQQTVQKASPALATAMPTHTRIPDART